MSAILAIALAGPISKWDNRETDLDYLSDRPMFDIERCLIDMPGRLSAQVYRQPDRPQRVTLTYPGPDGLSTGRIDLEKVGDQTRVVVWSMPRSKVTDCATPSTS